MEKKYIVMTDINSNIIDIYSSGGECIPIDFGNTQYLQFLKANKALKTYKIKDVYTDESKWRLLESSINQLLNASAWMTLPDCCLTPEQQTIANNYRTALMCLKTNYHDPDVARANIPENPFPNLFDYRCE